MTDGFFANQSGSEGATFLDDRGVHDGRVLIKDTGEHACDHRASNGGEDEEPKLPDGAAPCDQGWPDAAGGIDRRVGDRDRDQMSVSDSPIGMPAKPVAAPLDVVPMMIIRKKSVRTNSATKEAFG